MGLREEIVSATAELSEKHPSLYFGEGKILETVKEKRAARGEELRDIGHPLHSDFRDAFTIATHEGELKMVGAARAWKGDPPRPIITNYYRIKSP